MECYKIFKKKKGFVFFILTINTAIPSILFEPKVYELLEMANFKLRGQYANIVANLFIKFK